MAKQHISATVDEAVKTDVQAEAAKEERKESQMVNILLKEALAARITKANTSKPPKQ